MYSRKVDGKTLSFEHARFLHLGSFVMYDCETLSLWVHATGEAISGEYQGRLLEFVPSTVTTWENWRTEHPTTQVLDVKKGMNARFDLRQNPASGGLSVGQPDNELKFYPFSMLRGKRLVNDQLAGKKVVVTFDPETFAFAAFERGNRMFSYEDGKMVDQSGAAWDPLSGNAGEATLNPIPVVPWLTEAWKQFYPDGVIYSTE